MIFKTLIFFFKSKNVNVYVPLSIYSLDNKVQLFKDDLDQNHLGFCNSSLSMNQKQCHENSWLKMQNIGLIPALKNQICTLIRSLGNLCIKFENH